MAKKTGRVTLTKSQAASAVGTSLLKLLGDITEDGEVSLGEIDALRGWLHEHDSHGAEIRGISWLRELVEDIVADGVVTSGERIELLLGIERLMPKDQRELAQEPREVAKNATLPMNSMSPPLQRSVKSTTSERWAARCRQG